MKTVHWIDSLSYFWAREKNVQGTDSLLYFKAREKTVHWTVFLVIVFTYS